MTKKKVTKAERPKAEQRYSLASVRHALGKTQVELAARVKVAQADISVIEHRDDVRLSTLTRYAKALGGKVETAILVGNDRFVLDLQR